MPTQRSLSAHPNLRYFKLEAKRRLRAAEFSTLHEAQQAIAREHGLPGWTALRQLIDSRHGAEGSVLTHLRWVISRFRNAGEPGWAPPGQDELQEHFSDDFLAAIPVHRLVASITGHGVDLLQHPVITAQTPLAVQLRIADIEVHASGESRAPHRISSLYGFSFPASVTEIGVGAVTGHQVSADGSFAPVPTRIWTVPAAGGLWTTAADLVRFAAGWPSLLPAALAREALRPQARRGPGAGSVGLGWLIAPDGGVTGHAGLGPGTASSLLIRRADNQIQVALTNRDAPVEPANIRVLDAITPMAGPGNDTAHGSIKTARGRNA